MLFGLSDVGGRWGVWEVVYNLGLTASRTWFLIPGWPRLPGLGLRLATAQRQRQSSDSLVMSWILDVSHTSLFLRSHVLLTFACLSLS